MNSGETQGPCKTTKNFRIVCQWRTNSQANSDRFNRFQQPMWTHFIWGNGFGGNLKALGLEKIEDRTFTTVGRPHIDSTVRNGSIHTAIHMHIRKKIPKRGTYQDVSVMAVEKEIMHRRTTNSCREQGSRRKTEVGQRQ